MDKNNMIAFGTVGVGILVGLILLGDLSLVVYGVAVMLTFLVAAIGLNEGGEA